MGWPCKATCNSLHSLTGQSSLAAMRPLLARSSPTRPGSMTLCKPGIACSSSTTTTNVSTATTTTTAATCMRTRSLA